MKSVAAEGGARRHQWGDDALAGLCAALLPTEAGGPEPRRLARTLGAFLDRQPPLVAGAVRAGAVAVDAASVLTAGRRLGHLDVEAREAVVARLARLAATGPGFDGLKAIVMLVAGSDRAAAETLASARSHAPARPDAAMDVTPSLGWPSTSRWDVVVVGSGAGGAMAARTLARAGLHVAVVEEGRRHVVEEFRTRHPLERFAELYRDGGSTAALGLPPVILPIGRGVGGTTLVNSGTCYRTPASVLRRWRDDAGLAVADPDTFTTYLDEVWATLQVDAVPLDVMGRNGLLALAGADKLGWRAGPLQRNAPGCGGCCQCSIGCPRNAKFGVHLNALPQACAAGARIVSEARVERVDADAGPGVTVVARRPDGSRLTLIATSGVVVAAGATETPLLLRRSGLGSHPAMGRNLALHPAVGASGRFADPVIAWRGVLQSAAVEEFHESDGVLVEATSTPPGMGSVLLPGVGRDLVAQLESSDHLATLGAMVADEPSGRVLGRRRAVLRYDLSRRDGGRLVKAIGVMGQVLFAAGASEVLTGIRGHQVVRDEAELDDALAHADPRHLHVAAFHPVGTAGAGADVERHPVDPNGALRGARRVWVADASVLPSCPEVNPQVSVMALALAVADRMLAAL